MRRVNLAVLGLATVLSFSALAQNAPPATPVRVTGTIEHVVGKTVTIKTPTGPQAVKLTDDARVMNNKRVTIKEIGNNTFLGTTAVQGSDGKLHATEIHIFPEAMRGAGEGHRPWFADKTTMTNGSVTTMTNGSVQQGKTGAAGTVLKVTYPGGVQDIHVAPDTPITLIENGDFSLLKHGVSVTTLVSPQPDGTVTAPMISVGGFF